MTFVFVRHAQPDHTWIDDDSTRPLTIEGQQDSKTVLELMVQHLAQFLIITTQSLVVMIFSE